MREKGITLIALVITIIVLLILAGVSIATLTGDNGILTQATKAKEETEIATEEEQRKLAMAEAAMNFENTEYNGVPIPVGFAPTKIDGESTIDEGLVIVDNEGNSYVWIEVPKSIYTNDAYTTDVTMPINAESYADIEKVLKKYVGESYRGTNGVDEWYAYSDENLITEDTVQLDNQKQLKNGCGLSLTEYKELKNKMLKSVYENGGFWIGQYEMGTDTVRTSADVELTSSVCKEGEYPYNWVTCSQAQDKASSMSSGNYTSSLMFGIQWDLVMKYIEIKGEKYPKKDCSEWGNYLDAQFDITKGKYSTDDGRTFTDVSGSYQKPKSKNVLLTTGATERNSILNIYDIAGNLWEWTLEKSADTNRFLLLLRWRSQRRGQQLSSFSPLGRWLF